MYSHINISNKEYSNIDLKYQTRKKDTNERKEKKCPFIIFFV